MHNNHYNDSKKSIIVSVDKETATDIFFWYIRSNFKTSIAAAQYYNITPQYLSGCIHGKRSLNKKMLEDIGLRKIQDYEIINPLDKQTWARKK